MSRYEKSENILQLVMEMQARRMGMSLQDIMDKFDVGRRTAMRMRDAVERVFVSTFEEVKTDERIKRWRLASGTVDKLITYSSDELADLQTAANLFREQGRDDRAVNLESISAKIQATMRPETHRRLEPDLEGLMEAEGIARRPGPRPNIRLGIVEALRDAILGCQTVKLDYLSRSSGKRQQHIVHPYGFLHGHRHYLVGILENGKTPRVMNFSLPNIDGVEVLDDMFEKKEGFDLQDYADLSFGFYHQEPFKTVWRFSPKAAPVAREFRFHPNQTSEDLEDGAHQVSFTAGGDLEMAWHLLMWGSEVEVIEPKGLKEMVEPYQADWPGMP